MMRLISMANLIKKTLQDKYLSDFLCLSQVFFSEWIGGSDLTIREVHYISPTILINWPRIYLGNV